MTMTPEKPSLRGKNMTELKKDVRKITDAIRAQKEDRRATNEEIAALRAKAETLGIHKAALDMAMRYMDWEPEKRENFDIAYMIVREAMGLPVQNDLFGFADEVEKKNAAAETRTEADAVFAGRAPRDEEKIADVTASELKEGEAVLEGSGAPITEEALPSKKPGKLDPVVDDQRGKDDF